jgi:hypothetical protein
MAESDYFEVRYEEQMADGSWDPFTYGPTTESGARAYYEVWAARPDTRNVKLDGPEGVLNPDA